MNRRGPLIAAVASGVVALLVLMLFVLPKMGQVGQSKDDLQKAQDAETSLLGQLSALQDAEAAAPETQKEIQKVDTAVPPTPDLPALFRQLQAAADRSGVDFFVFSPGVPTPDASATFSIMTSQITVSGTFFAIDEFLFQLETLPRANKVTSIGIASASTATTDTGSTTTPATGTPGQLQLQVTVEFYTTDVSAGPGSVPGPTTGATGAVPAATVPTTVSETPSPTPGA